jgi:hypothetical protein
MEVRMTTLTDAHAEHARTQLAARLEHWRPHRPSRTACIPAPIWEHAIALTAVLPLAYVAKRLRLRGNDLKKRCAARHEEPGADPLSSAFGFVEVPTAPAWPLPTSGIEIDLHRPDGARLRIAVPESQLSLTAVVRTFLETPS